MQQFSSAFPREDWGGGGGLSLASCRGTQAASDTALCPSPSTCACVEYYGKALEALVRSVKIMCIHGKMKYKRNKIFMEFRQLQRSVSFLGGGRPPATLLFRRSLCFKTLTCVVSLPATLFLL